MQSLATVPYYYNKTKGGYFPNGKFKTGLVISAKKMSKSAVVAVDYFVHLKPYNKTIRRTAKIMIHDPEEICDIGDKVRIRGCRKMSRKKFHEVDAILEKNPVAAFVQKNPEYLSVLSDTDPIKIRAEKNGWKDPTITEAKPYSEPFEDIGARVGKMVKELGFFSRKKKKSEQDDKNPEKKEEEEGDGDNAWEASEPTPEQLTPKNKADKQEAESELSTDSTLNQENLVKSS